MTAPSPADKDERAVDKYSSAPHVPAAFINAITEEGSKAEAIEYLQKEWNENCSLRQERLELLELLKVARAAVPECGARPPDELIKIDDGQSTHARTAKEWLDLARADLAARSWCGALPRETPRTDAVEAHCVKMGNAFGDYARDFARYLELAEYKSRAELAEIAQVGHSKAHDCAPVSATRTLHPELVERLRSVSAFADEYALVQAAADALEGRTVSTRPLILPEREKLPCGCCIPPNYDGCDCGNSGDTMSQGSALGWNACLDKIAELNSIPSARPDSSPPSTTVQVT